jgi:hypothetical protein
MLNFACKGRHVDLCSAIINFISAQSTFHPRSQAENADVGRQLEATLTSLADRAAAINAEETLFGWDKSEWPQARDAILVRGCRVCLDLL